MKKLVLIFAFALLAIPYPLAFALTPECLPSGSPATPRADFLVTATSLIGKFGSAKQVCIVNHDRAAFVSYKIPAFADLKSLYYTQAKTNTYINKVDPYGDNPGLGPFQTAIASSGKDSLYFVNGTLNINGTFLAAPVDKNAVVFIEKDLNINSNITYGSNNAGIIFVVGGDVAIGPSVTVVNAVIISSGTIFTAGSNCATSAVTPVNQLVINGSLISLNPLKPIQFCRKLTNNSLPAEKINHQSKYVVILRNIFADTLQKWSEI